MDNLTPTQQRIVDILGDGQPHHRDEIRLAIDPDGFSTVANVRVHINHIRQKLPANEMIHAVNGGTGGRYYQWVTRLTNPYDGRR